MASFRLLVFVQWVLLILLCVGAAAAAGADYTQYVRPFFGAEGAGHMFPGPTRPFGVVKLGPDLWLGQADEYAGYDPNGKIVGFSMLHESGTGGAPKYGVVSQMPAVGNVTNPLADMSMARAGPDEATVGYYKTTLASNVTVELAATDHAGLYQYGFPQGGGSVVVDVSHLLPSFRGQGLSQNYVSGNLTVTGEGRWEGSGVYNNGWNRSPNWTIFFCGYFDTPSTARTFTGNGSTLSSYGTRDIAASVERVGAVFSFNETSIKSRVGVSFISSAKACQFVNDEIPASASLSSLVDATQSIWNTNVLGKVTTTDKNQTNLELLYTSLYGMHLLPSNRTGENPLWSSTEPYYDDIYTLWDLYQTSMPLMQILQPQAHAEQIRSLIDIYRHEGYMPDARSSNYNGRIQGGTNADNVLADAYVKGVTADINWADGYKAMLKNAEVTPANNFDPMSMDSSTKEGRGALPDWHALNYVAKDHFNRSVTRAVEYAANDFCLSQVASGLGLTADAEKYLQRSRNWRNHWDRSASSLGYSGFVMPRFANGTFFKQDPLSCKGCYWADDFYEALPWDLSFYAHHDMATLVNYTGGAAAFVSRLDALLKPGGNSHGDPRFDKSILNPGNEPSFTSPYLFHFARRQDLSVLRSRHIAQAYYGASNPTFLPGNSDAGAMQSWLLWQMLGLYPLTGQTTFLVGSPWFDSLSIALPGGKSLAISARNRSADAFYVQSLSLNGQPWPRNWIPHSALFQSGGSLEFVMGPHPAPWDAAGELPPSLASEAYLTYVATKKRESRKRAVAFGVMGLVLFGLLSTLSLWAWRRLCGGARTEKKAGRGWKWGWCGRRGGPVRDLEKDGMEKDGMEKDGMEKDGMEKDPLEKDDLNKTPPIAESLRSLDPEEDGLDEVHGAREVRARDAAGERSVEILTPASSPPVRPPPAAVMKRT